MTPERGHLGEPDRVVVGGEDRLGQVKAHLCRVDVEGGHELGVADVIAPERDVHEARDPVVRIGVAVVLDALHERAGAVADSRDGDLDLAGRLSHGSLLSLAATLSTGHAPAAAGVRDGPRELRGDGRRFGRRDRRRRGQRRPLGGDELIDPGQIVFGHFAGVLDERALVPVERPPRRLHGPTGAFPDLHELGTTALQERQAVLGAQVASKGPAQREAPPVFGLGVLGLEQVVEELVTPGGELVDATPTGAAA